MNCKTFVELVTAYLEGQLSAEDRAASRSTCGCAPGCDRYLDQFRTTISLLGQLPEESISSGARTRLLDAFADWRDRGPDGQAEPLARLRVTDLIGSVSPLATVRVAEAEYPADRVSARGIRRHRP